MGFGLWYDKQGQPIDASEVERLQTQEGYKRVGGTVITSTVDPSQSLWISTVWLGLDHSWDPNGPPLIFETMIFEGSGQGEVIHRYPTQETAQAGHQSVVLEVMERLAPAASVEDSSGDGFFLDPTERRERLRQLAADAEELMREMTNGQDPEGVQ
jgi:hypothetical protein